MTCRRESPLRSLFNIVRGLWLLRHDAVIHDLGKRRLQRLDLDAVRDAAPHSRVSDTVMTFGYRPGLFIAGEGTQIREGSMLAFGDDNNGYGRIQIGARTWIGQYNNLRAGGGDIVIGDDCLISQFCNIVASNHAHARGMRIQSQGADPARRGVVIGHDVWLGAGCAIMPGVVIGEGVIVGANAVVTTDIPAYEIWGGVPARKIGERQ